MPKSLPVQFQVGDRVLAIGASLELRIVTKIQADGRIILSDDAYKYPPGNLQLVQRAHYAPPTVKMIEIKSGFSAALESLITWAQGTDYELKQLEATEKERKYVKRHLRNALKLLMAIRNEPDRV